MTELQMGLIGLGAAAVAGVLGYNKWQEYRQRKLAEQLLDTAHGDVLLDDAERAGAVDPVLALDSEPVLGADSPRVVEPDRAAPVVPVGPGERLEPSLGGEPAMRLEPTLASAEPAPRAPLPVDGDLDAPAPRRAVGAAGNAGEVAKPSTSQPAGGQVQAAASARTLDELKAAGEPLHLLSPQVDYIAAFDAVEAIAAAHIVEAQRAALARVRKAVHWIGYNEQTHEWEALLGEATAYRHFRAGLQLVDRRGPLADGDLSLFHTAMQDLADQSAAIVDLPARRTVLDGAAKLDAFCASVDIQIGINVVAQGQVFSGTKLRALAESAGMVIDGEGRFVRCDDDGNVLYVLLNQDGAGFSAEAMKSLATQGITFLLDVPRVAHGERVFNQMVELARRFADVLRGVLVDDNRRPLSELALEPIRRQVAEYQAMMAAQGLPAGGPLARRLFS